MNHYPGSLARALSLAVAFTLPAGASAAEELLHEDFSTPERAFVLDSEAAADQCEGDGLPDMCDGQLTSGELDDWTLIDLGEQFIITDTSDVDELDAQGDTVVRFSEQDDGLEGDDDGIAQCVNLSQHLVDQAEFSLTIEVTSEFPRQGGEDNVLPVDLAVREYETSENCDDELDEDLDLGTLDDIQRLDLVASGGADSAHDTIEIEPWEWGTAELSGSFGDEVMSVAVFVGTGDQTDDGGQPTGPRQTWIDAPSFTIDGIDGGDNLLANTDFLHVSDGDTLDFAERTPFPDDDQGPFRWVLTDLEHDGGAAVELWPNDRTALEDMTEPQAGDRAFKFRYIEEYDSGELVDIGEVDDDNLDRCIDISDAENRLTIEADFQTNQDDFVYGLVTAGLYEDQESCLNSPGDSPLAFGDIEKIAPANSWQTISTSLTSQSNHEYLRVSLRAGEEGGQRPETRVLIDQVTVTADVAPGDGQSISSSSCSMGRGGTDPVLGLLVAGALLGLARRRRRGN